MEIRLFGIRMMCITVAYCLAHFLCLRGGVPNKAWQEDVDLFILLYWFVLIYESTFIRIAYKCAIMFVYTCVLLSTRTPLFDSICVIVLANVQI